MKKYAYIRSGEAAFIQMQVEAVTKYGYDVLEVNTNNEIHSSKAVQQVVSKMAEGDILLVASLFCFGLRSKKLHELFTQLREEKKEYIVIEEGLDSREKSGDNFYAVLTQICNMERKVISETTLIALVEARKDGAQVGRPTIEEDKVQEVRQLYSTKNLSMRQISKMTGISVSSVSKYVQDIDKRDRRRKTKK